MGLTYARAFRCCRHRGVCVRSVHWHDDSCGNEGCPGAVVEAVGPTREDTK